MTDVSQTRRDALATRLAAVRTRIEHARAASGRTDEVRLVVVTKTFPASDVDLLAELGVTDVGENRDQEARHKYGECSAEARALTWHMIGQLQRNKASSVATWADVVESVDRAALVPALARAAAGADRTVGVLLQVNLDLDPDPGRGGALPADLPSLADLVAAEPALRLDGLMAVAPHPASDGAPHDSFDLAAEAFARLRELSDALLVHHPDATVVSAGMSGDLEAAVAAGATQVRVGGAILGARDPVQ